MCNCKTTTEINPETGIEFQLPACATGMYNIHEEESYPIPLEECYF